MTQLHNGFHIGLDKDGYLQDTAWTEQIALQLAKRKESHSRRHGVY